jgi:transcription elongation factor Elf1
MRKLGFDVPSCTEGKLVEAATYTCPHCNGIVVKEPKRTRERAYCYSCGENICDACGVKALSETEHKSFNKYLDEVERSAYREQQNNLSLRSINIRT